MSSLIPSSKGSFADSDGSSLSLNCISTCPTSSSVTSIDDTRVGVNDLKVIPSNEAIQVRLRQLENVFMSDLSNEKTLHDVIDKFEHQYKQALSRSNISMLPCFNYISTGKETGRYLSLDLGGSTLRVSVINIDGPTRNAKVLVSQKYNIPDAQKVINEYFFDWIADRIHEVLFVKSSMSYFQKEINTGIIWSFPLFQTATNDGVLNKCGKGYILEEEMMSKLLKSLFEQSCLKKHNIHLKILSLVNDSVSVYISAKFFNQDTSMGLVLGTGTNVCLFLPTALITDDNKQTIHSNVLAANNHHICLFNTELSFFGQHLNRFTSIYDDMIHDEWQQELLKEAYVENNFNNIYQPLEFLTSGRYISELSRLVIVDFIEQGLIIQKLALNGKLFERYDHFTGEVCSTLSNSEDLEACKRYLIQLFGDKSTLSSTNGTISTLLVSDKDIHTIKSVIRIIADRAAAVLACSLLSLERLANHSHNPTTPKNISSIGYGGSVLKHFHYYREKVEYFLRILNPETRYQLDFVDDSSIYGAAISAAINNCKI